MSLVGVTLGIHLAGLGYSTTGIGLLIGVGLAGSSLATVVVSVRADRWGRRRALVALATLSAAGYAALAAFSDPAVLVPLAFVGMLNGMGRDRGAASALDQAILLAGPLIIGGVSKVGYDLLLYRAFRHVRPPEEQVAVS